MSLSLAVLRSSDLTLLWDETAKVKYFFLQRKFPHQAALPSVDAIRQLFKKHCNKVGPSTRSSLSLECPYMKCLFAFGTFVL